MEKYKECYTCRRFWKEDRLTNVELEVYTGEILGCIGEADHPMTRTYDTYICPECEKKYDR